MRLLRWCAGSLALLVAHQLHASCPPGALQDKVLQVSARQAAVYELSTSNLDVELRLRIDGLEHRLARPGRPFGPVYLLVPPADADRRLQVCIEPTFSHSGPGELHWSSPPETEEVPAWVSTMYQADRYWASAQIEDQYQALALYRRIVAEESVALEVRYAAQLAAVQGAITHSQFNRALDQIARWSDEFSAAQLPSFRLAHLEGTALLIQLRPREALAILQRAHRDALAWQQQNPNQSIYQDLTSIRVELAEAQLTAGWLEQGEQTLHSALASSDGDHRLLAAVHNNLGYLHVLRAQQASGSQRREAVQRSVEEHLRAANYATSAGDRALQTSAFSNVANQYLRLGELQLAQRYFLEALAVVEGRIDQLGSIYIYLNLGYTASLLGDYARAEKYLELVRELAAESAPRLAVEAACDLAALPRKPGTAENGVVMLSNCVEQALAQGSWGAAFEAYLALHESFVEAGDTEQAMQSLLSATDLLDRVGSPDLQVELSSRLSLQYHAAGQAQLARQSEQQTLEKMDDLSRPGTAVEVYARLFELHYRRGQYASAMRQGEMMLEAIERVYASLDAERLGPAWSDHTHEHFVRFAEFLLGVHSPLDDDARAYAAFSVVERSRAVSLRQSLASADEEFSVSERRLARLSAMANEEAEKASAQNFSGLPLDYYQELDLLALEKLLEREESAFVPAVSLAEIQARLGAHQQVLFYFIGREDAWLFCIGPSTFRMLSLGPSAEARKLIASARDRLTQQGTGVRQFPAASTLLLPAGAIAAGVQELVIVPHRELHGFPFSVLQVAGEAGGDRPLIETVSILSTPSGSAFVMGNTTTQTNYRFDLAVLADPLFSTETGDNLSASDSFRSWSASLQRLPWTAAEATHLTQYFDAKRVLAYTGGQANRNRLMSDAVRGAQVLHIASHGYFSEESPDNVGLALSPFDDDGNPAPGFITLTELFSKPFHNLLVVISGCETGMGRSRAGEGMLGMSRGFIAQGVPYVVSTVRVQYM